MGLDLEHADGQTPLSDEEKEGLLIKTIGTREELDEFEQQNIEKAIIWTMRKKFKVEDILRESFIKELHRRMYGEIWAWAGDFRTTSKNIGVDKFQIQTELRKLIDDGKFWITHHSFSEEEIAVRFKHRLVSIHCFANGNGRHSRLLADIMIEHIFKRPLFSWGATSLTKKGEAREAYLLALKKADRGDYSALIKFARL